MSANSHEGLDQDTPKMLSRRGFLGGVLSTAAVVALSACGETTKATKVEETPEEWQLNRALLEEYISSLPTEEDQLEQYRIPLGMSPEEFALAFLNNLDYRENFGVNPEVLYELFGGTTESTPEGHIMFTTPEGLNAFGTTEELVEHNSLWAWRKGMFNDMAWGDTIFAADTRILNTRIKAAHVAALKEAAGSPDFTPVERTLYGVEEIVLGDKRGFNIYCTETGGKEDREPLSSGKMTTDGVVVRCFGVHTNEASGETPWAENGHAEYAQIIGIGLVETLQP